MRKLQESKRIFQGRKNERNKQLSGGEERSNMNDVKELDLELVMADDFPALFTCARVDRKIIPDGLYCYDVRHDDDCQGIACEIKSYVMVNHWGTLITKQEILLNNGSYFLNDGLDYLGRYMDLEEFMKADLDQIIAEEMYTGIMGLETTL